MPKPESCSGVLQASGRAIAKDLQAELLKLGLKCHSRLLLTARVHLKHILRLLIGSTSLASDRWPAFHPIG